MTTEHPRYQIVEVIAQGDFATVYRGIDRELNREIAIKQIHEQYLADPKKLEQYWGEAQLLARLEHPYIMTIYDIVKDRGWLILELMQGSLPQQLRGQPIDIEDLRLTIIYMCQALKFLQDNGIVHGDVKPSNLLLDKNHRVKLGDFGIARRLSQHEGSVIKGTTKYMAPEVLSDQFGDVGPASDLYSLGFSAYELLCGEHFDSLFPTLNIDGRDPQVAWMMWHSAVDRQLPAIGRVLEGVPEDLARVIHRLTEKDPSKRYRSADEVIYDLKASSEGKDPDALKAEEQAQAQLQVERQKKRQRWAYAAVGVSFLLTLAMLFMPNGQKETVDVGPVIPESGILQSVDFDRSEIHVLPSGGKTPVAVLIAEEDEFSLNGQQVELSDLRAGDRLVIKDGSFRSIKASRSSTEVHSGRLAEVDVANARIYVDLDGETERVEIDVPFGVELILNGRPEVLGRSLQLEDLQSGDDVTVQWLARDGKVIASSIESRRPQQTVARLVRVDTDRRTIEVEIEGEPQPILFRLEDACRVELNGTQELVGGQVVGLDDLRAGDELVLAHTDSVQGLEAARLLQATGIVKNVTDNNRSLTVELQQPAVTVSFKITEDAEILDRAWNTIRPWDFVRPGDRVTLSHTSVDLIDPIGTAVEVEPKVWDDRWALVIACGDYEDAQVSSLPSARFDADLLDETLATFYRVPDDRRIILRNPSQEKIQDELARVATQVGPNDQLLIFFVGHGYLSEAGEPWLAASDFELSRMDSTGISLRKLILQLEEVSTGEVLMFLETCHSNSGEDRSFEPPAVELVEPLKRSPVHPVSTAVTVLVSGDSGQRGQQLGQNKPDLFTQAVADVWRENNDVDGNGRMDSEELVLSLPAQMRDLAQKNGLQPQTPIRFLADDRPPRLTPSQRDAVVLLMEGLAVPRFKEIYRTRYNGARAGLENVPDGDLIYALVALRHNRTGESKEIFRQVITHFPQSPVAYQALASQEANSRNYETMLGHLVRMVETLPDTTDPIDQTYVVSALSMAGALRQFVLDSPDAKISEAKISLEDVKPLDEVVLRQTQQMQDAYRLGIESVREIRQEKMAELDGSMDAATENRLRGELERPSTYTQLDIDVIAEYIRFHLEDR
jgi:serine/threonine protein kinase